MTARPEGEFPFEERLARLRLLRSENVGPITFHELIARFGSGAAALDALPELARQGGRARPIRLGPRDRAEAELEALSAEGARVLFNGEPDYPERLAEIADAPPFVSVLGDAELLARRCVAVVGARNASANGRRLAETLAAELGGRGYVVVSGLARGVDTAAHKGSLAGGTVAVVAGGLDVVYPQENIGLYEEIAARGALLSEMPPGTVPQARHFPRRNRLISGLALGVLVVEAAPRSGSLITARMALEQGREVFAVPGSPLDPRARGCNDLLRQGAVLTETADDVEAVLDGMLRPALGAPQGFELPEPQPVPDAGAGLEPARREVVELLAAEPVMVDEILRRCQVSPAIVNTVLLELELAGRLERHPGNRVSLRIPGSK